MACYPSLLSRQTDLLAYLSDPAVGRGDTAHRLSGIDAEISHRGLQFVAGAGVRERRRKIASVLPATCKRLGSLGERLLTEFLGAVVPRSIRSIEHAEQFHDFLLSRNPAGLVPEFHDILSFEMAVARVFQPEGRHPYLSLPVVTGEDTYRLVSRYQTAQANHDLRPLSNRDWGGTPLRPRINCLVLLVRRDTGGLRIVEVLPSQRQFLEDIRKAALAGEVLSGATSAQLAFARELGILDQVR